MAQTFKKGDKVQIRSTRQGKVYNYTGKFVGVESSMKGDWYTVDCEGTVRKARPAHVTAA